MNRDSFDVVIVGGGFAGVTAARDLSLAGLHVILLEAAHRLGGRTFVRRFDSTSVSLEFGGTWVLPGHHPAVMSELARYGIATDPTPRPTRFVSRLLGEITSTHTIPEADIDSLVSAFRHDSLLDGWEGMSLGAYLSSSNVSPLGEAWLRAYCHYLNGASAEDVALADMVGIEADFLTDIDHYSEKIQGGTSHLLAAIAAEFPFVVALGQTVTAIRSSADEVAIELDGGETLTARAALVTAPLNTWSQIAFNPPLSPAKARLAESGHAGHSVKLWLLVEGMSEYVRVVDSDGPFGYLRTEKVFADGTAIIVAFGYLGGNVPLSLSGVQAELDVLIPGARVRAVDSHDWNRDTFARGTWAALRPGQRAEMHAGRQPEGRVWFASADISAENTGTIEAAVQMGGQAAAEIIRALVP